MQEVSGSIPLSSTKPSSRKVWCVTKHLRGAIAQLGERLHGMQEVSGSIPLSSTTFQTLAEKRGFFVFPSLKLYLHTNCELVTYSYLVTAWSLNIIPGLHCIRNKHTILAAINCIQDRIINHNDK